MKQWEKNILLIILILLSLSISSCSNKDSNEVNSTENLNEFQIVEDEEETITVSAEEEKKETITVSEEEEKMNDIIFYYEDEYGFVVKINTKIPYEEGIAKATLRSMVVGSETEKRLAQLGFNGVLPEGTEIRGMSIKDGLCRVDFSKNILNTTSYEQEENMLSAIIYTLTEFPTINKFELLVEGQTLDALSNGYAVNTAFERENINLYGSADGVNYTVYYKAPDTDVEGHFVPLTFSANKVNNPTVNVIEKLFNGPPDDTELSNNIPVGVELRNVEVKGDKVVVNLGVEAVNLSEQEFTDMNAIVVLCLEQFDIANVEYNIEGLTFEEAGLDFEDDAEVPAFNQY